MVSFLCSTRDTHHFLPRVRKFVRMAHSTQERALVLVPGLLADTVKECGNRARCGGGAQIALVSSECPTCPLSIQQPENSVSLGLLDLRSQQLHFPQG